MESKKNYAIFTIGLILVLSIFVVSYYVTTNKLNAKSNNKPNDSIVYQSNNEDKLTDDTKIILKLRDEAKGKITNSKIVSLSEIKKDIGNNMDQKSLENYYMAEGYKLYSFTNKEVVFVKDVENKFEANKYYLGIQDGHVAIFKSDSEGKLFIEDKNKDIAKKLVDSLPEADKRLLKNYELKFDNKEEAYEQLAEIES